MTNKRSFFTILPQLLLLFCFLIGGVVSAQTHPKLQHDGKLKAKKMKIGDHHHKAEHKKEHHSVEWKHHNALENQTFSKKKKKKIK